MCQFLCQFFLTCGAFASERRLTALDTSGTAPGINSLVLHFPASCYKPFKHLDLQLFLGRDRNHVVTCCLILRHHLSRASRDPGRSPLQAAPLRNLCVLCVSALDSSSLALTLNLQLSNLNRVSFLSPSSPHLYALCVL